MEHGTFGVRRWFRIGFVFLIFIVMGFVLSWLVFYLVGKPKPDPSGVIYPDTADWKASQVLVQDTLQVSEEQAEFVLQELYDGYLQVFDYPCYALSDMERLDEPGFVYRVISDENLVVRAVFSKDWKLIEIQEDIEYGVDSGITSED